MSKKYDNPQVVHMLLRLVDDDGNVLRHNDGSEKLFQPNDSSYLQHISESFTPDTLEEVRNE